MPPTVISGEPGTAWENTGAKILWQLLVSWHNSCGQCIQYDHQISTFWPIPFHRGCVCRQAHVLPGSHAEPFVDFTEEILKLDPVQQSRVVGRANLQLIESGVVKWEDVVQRTRIRPLKEVVARHKLTVPQLTDAGVSRSQSIKAWAEVHTPERLAAAASREALVRKLRAGGLTADEVRREVASRLAERVGIGGGPSGPAKLRVVTPPPKPPSPPPKAIERTKSPEAPEAPKPTDTRAADLRRLKDAEAAARAEYDRLRPKGFTPELQAARRAWLDARKAVGDFETGVATPGRVPQVTPPPVAPRPEPPKPRPAVVPPEVADYLKLKTIA